MDVYAFQRAVLKQDAEALAPYFAHDAVVNWHCSNERFTAAEYIRANCEYPGDWDGEVERVCSIPHGVVSVTHVYPTDRRMSFHVTSFFTLREDKIAVLDEYSADYGPAPQWRREMHLGKKIVE